jgi:hypothetical protein
MLCLLTFAILGTATTTGVPAAVPVAPPAPTETTAGSRWYGGPAVVSDLGSVVLMVGGLTNYQQTPGVFYLGVAAYSLGGPVNHFDNGHFRSAAVSLLVRGLGFAGAFALAKVGLHANGCSSDRPGGNCDLLFLTPLPMLAAMVIDDGLVARHPIPEQGRAGTASSPGMSPGILLAPGGAAVSFRSSF